MMKGTSISSTPGSPRDCLTAREMRTVLDISVNAPPFANSDSARQANCKEQVGLPYRRKIPVGP